MWSDQTVEQLNQRQQDPKYHPYTCGTDDFGTWLTCNNWAGEEHRVFFRSEFIATSTGWICPRCNYTQDWYL
jgi:hypothetical protein